MTNERHGARARGARLAAMGTALLGLGLSAGGCGGSVIGGSGGGTGTSSTGTGMTGTSSSGTGTGGNGGFTIVEALTSSTVDKVDLLLMVDNSRSMADKQLILAATVPDLVQSIVNPACVDPSGNPSGQQPAGPLDPCPAGTQRRFHPITDVHLGIVTSSLGGHGSDACPNTDTFSCAGGATNTTNNDMGHLVSRTDPCAGGSVPTYQGKGFLAWDPQGKDMPPGETNIGAVQVDPTTGAVTTTSPGLVPSLKDLVLGAGQIGCGYESQLESWYRFLVDPDPYQTLTLNQANQVAPQGVDDVLLQQRKDFLRPSSLLVIMGLTDENDCSIKEYGQYFFAAQQRDPSNPNKNFYLPKARQECATNPNDTCCRSCGQDQTGCPPDPTCTGSLDAKTDDVNLRCWDQKRRFGIDFLYPIDRYVTGLTQPLVPNRNGEMVANPIYSVLDPTAGDTSVRDSSLVLLGYVAGVPWQDLAHDPHDASKGFKSATEMAMPDAMGHTTWDYIIGDPANYVPPLDPLMIESDAPRMGTSPLVGAALAPPTTAPGPGPNPVNGHEYTPGTQNGVQIAPDDLEYACIFPLPKPRDCSDPSNVSCDCSDPQNDDPLCEPNPNNGGARTLQARAKGYPGIRELSLVKAMGSQGIAGSICPAQLTDPTAETFGYRPVVKAIVDRLSSVADGGCFPKKLPEDSMGQVPCAVGEAVNTGMHLDAAACDTFCATQPGRTALTPAHQALRGIVLQTPLAVTKGADCVCEIPQLGGAPGCTSGSPLGACECDSSAAPVANGQPVNGWCYLDAANDPALGDPALLKNCPDTQKQLLRFVGNGQPANGGLVVLACTNP